MRTTLVISLVSVAALAFFFSIIGVFGILPALAALSLFVAFACVFVLCPRMPIRACNRNRDQHDYRSSTHITYEETL